MGEMDRFTWVTTETVFRCSQCDKVVQVGRTHLDALYLVCEQEDCLNLIPLPVDIEMRLRGAPVLPGFERVQ